MTERYYTYTTSHCSQAIRYGLSWLINELIKYKSEKGSILAVGKGNFCNKSTEVYKEGLGELTMKELCKYGSTTINNKKIELQYPRNMNVASSTSVVVIYPYKKLINKLEDRNTFLKSLLIIPWTEFDVDKWIEKYNPHRIDIECPDYYKFGSNRRS